MSPNSNNTERDLLEFLDRFRLVRGFAPRRVHVNRNDWLNLVMVQRGMSISGEAMFDGARIIKFYRDDVIAAIHAWDLLPPPGSDT